MQVELRARRERPTTPSEPRERDSTRASSPAPRSKSRVLLPASLIHRRKPSTPSSPPQNYAELPVRSRTELSFPQNSRSPPPPLYESLDHRGAIPDRPRMHRASTDAKMSTRIAFPIERQSSFVSADRKSPETMFAELRLGRESRNESRAVRERRVDSAFHLEEPENDYGEYSEGVAEHLNKLDELSNRIRKTLEEVDLDSLIVEPNGRDDYSEESSDASDTEVSLPSSVLGRSYHDTLARRSPRPVGWPLRQDGRSRTISEGGVPAVLSREPLNSRTLEPPANAFSRLDFLTKQIRSTLEDGSKIITSNELQVARLERDQHYAELVRLRDENKVLVDRLHYFREIEAELSKAKDRIRKLESDVNREVGVRTEDIKNELATLRRELDILRKQREEEAIVRMRLEAENASLRKHREEMAVKNNELFHSRLKLRSELVKTQHTLEEREKELVVVKTELESERKRSKALEDELEEERKKTDTREGWMPSVTGFWG